jgi:hypothetical protein
MDFEILKFKIFKQPQKFSNQLDERNAMVESIFAFEKLGHVG